MRLGLNVLLRGSVPQAGSVDIRRRQSPSMIRGRLPLTGNLLMGEGVGHDDDGIERAHEDQITRNRLVPETWLVLVEGAPRTTDLGHDLGGVTGKADVEGRQDRLHDDRGQLHPGGISVASELDLFAAEGEGVPDGVGSDALLRGEGDHGFDFDTLGLDHRDLDGLGMNMGRHCLQEILRGLGRYERKKKIQNQLWFLTPEQCGLE